MILWSLALLIAVQSLPTWSWPANISFVGEAPHDRAVFYAGGQYVCRANSTDHILANQIYVEQLTPVNGVKQPYPLVFIHGGGISGTQWLNKPDGGKGWASWFLDQGYQVNIIDVWSVGRSSAETLDTVFAGGTVELVELAFTAPQLYNMYYQARYHTQWPGSGTMGDAIFDTFYARFLPLSFSPNQQSIMRTSMCALLREIGPSILISHSMGSSTAFLATDGCPGQVKGHVSVEGDASPFANYDRGTQGANASFPTNAWGLTNVPLTYSPPVANPSELVKAQTGTLQFTDGLLSRYPCTVQADNSTQRPRQLVNIAKAPVLYLTGEASVHVLYDHCTVEFLRQAGVKVTQTYLVDAGIPGNGHFSMLEKNSDDIAGYINRWIQSTAK